ncbi:MAG: hypothetical protein K2K25_01330 [Muribaculaceae bacterium]|nr:hypothetical protein [Muribaculaceae bacterium]
MRKSLFLTAYLAITVMLFTDCSKSKSPSSDTGSGDLEQVSSSSSEYHEGSGSSSDRSSYTSVSSYSSDEAYSTETFQGNTASSEDWDEWLKSYDEFADEYITLLKKAQKGDMSALSGYVKYVEKAQAFADKIDSASGTISASQIAKFNRIQQKILKAASLTKIDMSNLTPHKMRLNQ